MDQAAARRLAHTWWRAIAETSYVPMTTHVAQALLAGLVDELVVALDAEVFDPDVGARAGAILVRSRFTSPAVVGLSGQVLGCLPGLLDRYPSEVYCSRLAALLGAFGQGFAAALQELTLAEQEAIRRAVLAARRQAQEALQDSNARFRAVFDNAAVAIAVADTQGILVEANPALACMVGRTVERLRGASVFDIFHPEDLPAIQRKVYGGLLGSGGGTTRLEERFRRGDGSYGWIRLAVTVVPASGKREAYLLAIGEDVTERRRLQAELYRQARHDPLTGLPNRTLLHERLQAAIAGAHDGDHVGLCFLDLDGFKEVNDRYGHGVGDRLLAAVAARLRSAVKDEDCLVSRIGGDEFVALVAAPAATEGVIAAAESMLAALAEPIAVDGHRVTITASIGVVVPPIAGAQPEALLDAADTGLYRAKADGRGQWVLQEHDTIVRRPVS